MFEYNQVVFDSMENVLSQVHLMTELFFARELLFVLCRIRITCKEARESDSVYLNQS